MPTMRRRLAVLLDAERRLAERDAAGYETPQQAREALAAAREEERRGRRANRRAARRGTGQAEAWRPYAREIMWHLERFDAILRAQHAADVGPADPDETPCKCGEPLC